MNVSVGILYAALDFLELLSKTPGIDQRFPDMFRSFSVASPRLTLDFAQRCGWVRFNIEGYLELSQRGIELLGLEQTELALRLQMADVIDSFGPSWAPLLSRGRFESLRYLPLDIQQCLREAGLLGCADDNIVSWWDTVVESIRRSTADAKLKIGRQGERLSLDFERKRTHCEPVWQSIESNLAGYDILSVSAPGSSDHLCIEVKASNSNAKSAVFHLTRLEWEVAQRSERYAFHLWALLPRPMLYRVDPVAVATCVPSDNGAGHWGDVTIPFESILGQTKPEDSPMATYAGYF